MTSICEEKNSAGLRLIHAEHVSKELYIILGKKTYTQLKTIACRNTWLENQKLLIIDLTVNINLDCLKKTVHNRPFENLGIETSVL